MDLYRPISEGLLTEEPTRFSDMYGAGTTGLLFAPGAGVTDLMGYAPDPAQPGEYLPSFGENIREGNYLDAALQTLGGAGDVMMAGGAVFPPLVGVGAAMKAPRAARVAQSAPASIRAYHGSPHDFAPAVRVLDTETGKTYVQEAGDPILTGLMAQNPGKYEIIEENPLGMFDLSKMGTGEGAQAYGDGAYLSGAEDIARGYRDALSQDTLEFPDGTSLPFRTNEQSDRVWSKFSQEMDVDKGKVERFAKVRRISEEANPAARYKDNIADTMVDALSSTNDPEEAVGFLREMAYSPKYDPYERMKYGFSREEAEVEQGLVLEAADRLEEYVNAGLSQRVGKMYEAEIKVGPEELLDYDAPLKGQNPDIKKRMRDMVENELTEMDAVNLGYDIGEDVDLKGAREFMLSGDTTVDQFLGNWQALRGSSDAGEFLLNKYGIPGLKYKAGGSRAPGMDEADIDRNYVIFDENMINILRKYGLLAPLVGGGTAAAVMGADEPQPAGGIL